jgi:hypothetical protein
MPRNKTVEKKGKSQTETRTGAPVVPKTEEQLVDELVNKITENAKSSGGKYIQVSEEWKKVGPGLTLTGLERVYKQPQKSDFIYSREFLFAGSTRVVDRLLSKLGSSVAGQRLKNDIIDLTNYQDHLVTRVVNKTVQPDVLITHDKMSELVKLVKQTRNNGKEEKGTPKKKKAQRRKSPTGVKVARSPRVVVERISGTVSSLSDILKKLAEKQLGLDVTNVTYEETTDGLVVSGSKAFKLSNKRSKRVVVDHAGGHIGSETSSALENLLRKTGHSEEEVKSVVDSHVSKQNLHEGKEEKKEVVKSEAPTKKTKKSELRGSPKVTKAKTKTVKPRTSNE